MAYSIKQIFFSLFAFIFLQFLIAGAAMAQASRPGQLLVEKTDSHGTLTQWNVFRGDSSMVRIEKNTPDENRSELLIILGPKSSRVSYQIFEKLRLIVATPQADTLKQKRWEDATNSELSLTRLPDEKIDSLICKHFAVLRSDGRKYECWTRENVYGQAFYKDVFEPQPDAITPYLPRFREQGLAGDPIRMVERDKAGKFLSIFEFKAFLPASQPDPHFALPEGYRKIQVRKY